MKTRTKYLLSALLVFLCAASLYMLTLCTSAYPYGSAESLVVHLGLSPFAPTSNPIFGFVVRLLAGLPSHNTVLNIHYFCALLGAVTLVLLFGIITQFSHDRTREERSSDADPVKARIISGLFGCAYLATSIPFWMISTRAFPVGVGEFLFLACIFLGLLAFNTRHKWLIFPTCLLWGIGLAEFSTFIVFSPFFFLFALGFAYVTRRKISIELLFRMGAFVLIGLSLHFVTAYFAWQHPSARWKNMPGYYGNLLHVLKTQKFNVFDVIPKQGWLLLALTCILPLVVTLVPKTAEKRRGLWTSKLMHFVFFVIGIMLSVETFVSPWSQFKFAPLTVTPIVLSAIWMGYLAGYGYMVLFTIPEREHAFFRGLRVAEKIIYFPVLIILLGLVGWSNFRVTDSRDNQVVEDWAEGLLGNLQDGDWLISGYGIEDVAVLKAHEQGRKIHIINPALSQKEAYQWYMASLFEEPRLKSLAHISLNALLSEWMEMDAEHVNKLAVSRLPDFWFAAGQYPVPDLFTFRGTANKDEVQVDKLVQRHQAMWGALDIEHLQEIKQSTSPLAQIAAAFLREQSKMANNLGVLCQSNKDYNLAVSCYEWARKLDLDNPSALLNLVVLSEQGLVKDAARINSAYVSFISNLPARLRIWSLSVDYGYVYDANAFLDRGMSWVVSGKPHLAIAEIKQAMEIAKDSDRMRLSLAYMYFADQQVGESEKLYIELLEKNPNDVNALLGLSRICTLRSEFSTARAYLDRIKEQLKEVNSTFRLEEFALEYMMGRRDEAKKILEQIVKAEPNNAKAWTGLAVLATEDDDDKAFQDISKKIQTSQFIDNGVRVMFAQMLSARGDFPLAKKFLVQVLATDPNNQVALEQILRIHVREVDREEAERRVHQLLTLDPKNAYGNMVLGSLHFIRRQLLLAEASYRASMKAKRTPEILNDLSYVLSVMRKYDEAYPLITESLQVNPRNPGAWDTMAMVQLGLGKFDLAHTSMLRALELSPKDPIMLMHHAAIYEKRGATEEALKIVRQLTANLDSFPMEAQGELIDLQARLRRKSSGEE